MSNATAAPAAGLQFAARAKVRKREYVHERVFASLCGRYAVVEVKPLVLDREIEWLAIRILPNGNEWILGRKRVRDSAEQVCIDHLGGVK